MAGDLSHKTECFVFALFAFIQLYPQHQDYCLDIRSSELNCSVRNKIDFIIPL